MPDLSHRNAMQRILLGVLLLCLLQPLAIAADEITEAIQVIAKTGDQARGSESAAAAVRRLTEEDISLVPRLLSAMDTPNIVAANWYRQAYEIIVESELGKENPRIPVELLKEFVLDRKHQGRVRRLAWDLLDRVEPGFRQTETPLLLDDPEFGPDAVERTMQAAQQLLDDGKKQEAIAVYMRAFNASRLDNQIRAAADRLGQLGEPVNIIEHMGFLHRWYLLGPFDAPGFSGYQMSFPPEKKVDLAAEYTGKDGTPIRWQASQSANLLGQLNLATAIAPVKEAVGYAYAEFHSPREQDVQLRCGADDNMTVWINGKKTFTRLQWLNGTRLDRFTSPAHLEKGVNTILVKICQGPQHKNPAVPNNWSMQLRLCDRTGKSAQVRISRPLLTELPKP
ncbi:MAG: hypothetical protein VX715_07700 [Planctomycetota bacterium]|nr:hypothetical protein [Planctomycetota bacterium]